MECNSHKMFVRQDGAHMDFPELRASIILDWTKTNCHRNPPCEELRCRSKATCFGVDSGGACIKLTSTDFISTGLSSTKVQTTQLSSDISHQKQITKRPKHTCTNLTSTDLRYTRQMFRLHSTQVQTTKPASDISHQEQFLQQKQKREAKTQLKYKTRDCGGTEE